jgi:prepilin-type N-terminal cleavage/methylation domain-containing protein
MTRRGYTLIEMVLVMFLLVLVASLVFSLTGAGATAYLRLQQKQDLAADLRTGLSYLDVKIRSHDAAGQIWSDQRPDNGEAALVLRRTAADAPYVTWIFIHEGYLCELFIPERAAFSPGLGSRIAAADRLDIRFADERQLTVTLSRQTDDGTLSRSRTILLRSGGLLP